MEQHRLRASPIRKKLHRMWQDQALYLILAPTILYFCIFRVWPIINMRLAFSDHKTRGPWEFADRDLVFDRVYGALSGLAIGDSFGDASRKAENRSNYQVTTDFNKNDSWSADDTEFALLTAKTIIRCCGQLTTEECVRSWMEDVVTQDEYKRGGASEIEAANNLRKGLQPPLSGKFNTFHMSDGAAMRIGPIGILCAGDLEKAKELARIESEICRYRDGVWGVHAVAAVVAAAMVDTDTIGAVAGVILVARFGASRMPQSWLEKTRSPTGNVERIFHGQADYPLTEKGHAQARQAAEKLREVSFTRCCTSDLQRTYDTAGTAWRAASNGGGLPGAAGTVCGGAGGAHAAGDGETLSPVHPSGPRRMAQGGPRAGSLLKNLPSGSTALRTRSSHKERTRCSLPTTVL